MTLETPRATQDVETEKWKRRWKDAEASRQDARADLENALARERKLKAELSSLRSQVETLRMYTRHTPDCELEWPVARRRKSPEFGRYLMKRVNGKIAHGWDHQCGAAGFGLGADDVCYGCDRESEEREPDCTCGLSAALGKDSQ